MKSIAAIRTNRWTEEEERLLDSLNEAFETVIVVFQNRPKDISLPIPVVDVNDATLKKLGLGFPTTWGWQCGDFFYYSLRQAFPDFDHYWLVEPDVVFTANCRNFFEAFEQCEDDVLGYQPSPFPNDAHPFLETLQHLTPYRAIFALTRFSGLALDRLLELRRVNSKIPVSPRGFANDELFMFSYAHADNMLRIGDLNDFAPNWFAGAELTTNPERLLEEVLSNPQNTGKVFHPVRTKDRYKEALATRLSNKNGFLRRMKRELQYMSNDDMSDIARLAHDNVLKALKDTRG